MLIFLHLSAYWVSQHHHPVPWAGRKPTFLEGEGVSIWLMVLPSGEDYLTRT